MGRDTETWFSAPSPLLWNVDVNEQQLDQFFHFFSGDGDQRDVAA